MFKIPLKLFHLADDSYPILIEPGLFQTIAQDLLKKGFAQKYAIITDTHVKKLYGEELLKQLRSAGLSATLIAFQPGERQKTLATVERMAIQLLQLGHNRTSGILALGGGVVGDMAGFLASIFMRGIPFAQIPTTLMAMADSSIGGKTGVDLVLGKNLLGTFHQPKKVYIDPQLLSTLSQKQIQNGLAEVLKHGLIADKKILKLLKKFPDRALTAHTTLMTKLLVRSCRVKTNIVHKDERESHVRMLLNYGHTLGHAIEQASGYRLPHGFAIALGINLENRLAVERGLMKPKHYERVEEMLKLMKLPTGLPERIDREPILKALEFDKKNRTSGLTFTLLKKPGKPRIMEGITEDEVRAIL